MVDTLESTPENATHWSRASMAKKSGLSPSTIGRIWRAFELKPHRTDGFKLSNDPMFVEKVYDVVGLYLNPPEAAVVLCVDEKSQVQALARSQPAFPMMPGMPEKRTHDYVRHGTTSLFAAFNTADGTVISSLHRRHRTIEFRKFLIKIDTEVPDDLDIHLVCDNYGTHKTPGHPNGSPPTPGSICISLLHIPAGSTRSNGGSPTSPINSSAAATTAPSKPSRPTSAPGSRPGTTTRSHSSGPRPPNRSSPQSDDLCNESPARDTRNHHHPLRSHHRLSPYRRLLHVARTGGWISTTLVTTPASRRETEETGMTATTTIAEASATPPTRSLEDLARTRHLLVVRRRPRTPLSADAPHRVRCLLTIDPPR